MIDEQQLIETLRRDELWIAAELERLEEAGQFPTRTGHWILDEELNCIYEPSRQEIRAICVLVRKLRRKRLRMNARLEKKVRREARAA